MLTNREVELIAENKKLRDVLAEIARNCEGVQKGGLPHFSKRELADLVAYRARWALGDLPITVRSSTAVPKGEFWLTDGVSGVRVTVGSPSESDPQEDPCK